MATPFTFIESLVSDYQQQEFADEHPGQAEYPPERDLGDLALPWAMEAAEVHGQSPRNLAEGLASYLENQSEVESVSVEGPGFINCTLTDNYLLGSVEDVLESGEFEFETIDELDSVLLEFVSANPTGPLHVGHGRGAIYGDALGRLLEAHGVDVTREYYVNDAGQQIQRLAESLQLRAREKAGEAVEFSDNHYKGNYVKEIVDREDIQPDASLEELAKLGKDALLERIFNDLEACDIDFDNVVHESDVASEDALEDLMKALDEKGYLYEQNGAVFLRTTDGGDDKDRVLIKDDGDPTYFANDLVYHHEKYKRDFDRYVDVWGHDHHGYTQRLRAGLEFLGHNVGELEIQLYQLVDLYRSGEPVSMSTREGKFAPLADLVDEVGIDAVRFNFLTKSHDRPLDFDIDVATSESEDNPVYYVQYAHTRLSSILDQAPDDLLKMEGSAELTEEGHELLVKTLNFPYHLREATRSRAPNKVTTFLRDIARDFHSYYSKHRVIDEEYPERSATRLTIVRFLKLMFGAGLDVLGVDAPEEM